MEAIGTAVWAVGRFLWSGRPTKILFLKKILKSCNLPSNLFFECLNRFLVLLCCTNRFMPSFSSGYYYKVIFQPYFFRSHSFPGQSLLLSTTILHDENT